MFHGSKFRQVTEKAKPDLLLSYASFFISCYFDRAIGLRSYRLRADAKSKGTSQSDLVGDNNSVSSNRSDFMATFWPN